MPLTNEDKIKADISKIHGEINQILNQRYNLIAVTMTLFGLFLGALTQKDKFNFDIPLVSNVFVLSFFFLILLIVLAYVTRNLTRQFYVLRAYLIKQEYSIWESHYSAFRSSKNKYGYTETQRKLFGILGFLVLLITFIDQFLGRSIDPSILQNWIGPGVYILTFIFYIVFIFVLTNRKSKSLNESSIISRWDFLKNTSSESTDTEINSLDVEFHSQMRILKEVFEKLQKQNIELNQSKLLLNSNLISATQELTQTSKNCDSLKIINEKFDYELKKLNEKVNEIQVMNNDQKILLIDGIEKIKQQLTAPTQKGGLLSSNEQ